MAGRCCFGMAAALSRLRPTCTSEKHAVTLVPTIQIRQMCGERARALNSRRGEHFSIDIPFD